MKLLSTLASFVIFAFVVSSASAYQVCVGYDAQGICTGWVNTGGGGYTPNVPNSPSNPSAPNCTCAGYNANGTCTYWIGC